MNDNHAIPARLKDQHDQLNLVERIAGQAARDLPEPGPLSDRALARIAARIEARTNQPRRFRLGRVLVAASVLLGAVTVASATHLDLVPRWIAKLVGLESLLVTPAPSHVSKPRNAVRKVNAPEAPPVVEPPSAPSGEAPPTTTTTTTPAPVRAAETPSAGAPPTISGQTAIPEPILAPGRALAKARVADVPSGHGRLRTSIDHAGDDHHGDAPSVSGETTATRLAMTNASTAATSTTDTTPAVANPPLPMVVPPSPTARPTLASPPTPTLAPATPVMPATTYNPAARHLKDVVHALRIAHAPRTALDLLDHHASELAGNTFAEEALLLRVEAMLALKQQREALALLDRIALAATSSSSVLLVTRGQLRANANRCAEAVADFDVALARNVRPLKPALEGRAQCKQKLDDAQAAEADRDRLGR